MSEAPSRPQVPVAMSRERHACDARARGGACELWLADACAERVNLVAGVAAECCVDLRAEATPRSFASLRVHPLAALIALAAAGSGGDTALADVQRLAAAGITVIAYADGAQYWTLGARCQPLVVGARYLLDSAADDFADQLRRRVIALRDARTEQAAERQRILAAMRTLDIVGASDATFAMMRWLLRASPLSDLPVLIVGESGTGKELVARAIHRLDPKRRRGPFVAVNCAAISPGLAETELFGHRRSAFTGADRDRRGWFRAADGGILFLDELSELSTGVQAKLLRVLQERRLLGVGEDQEVPIDVRVIAASNQDIEQLVARAQFRGDLLHRLNVLPIRIAPLRERSADLRPLVEHLVAKCRSVAAFATTTVDDEFVAALARLALPGNVRELENLVWRALLQKGDDAPLGIADLPPDVWRALCDTAPDVVDDAARGTRRRADVLQLLESHRGNLAGVMNACEKLVLQATLERVHGNQSKAAVLLGVTPRSVYNKLRKHHLADPRAGS